MAVSLQSLRDGGAFKTTTWCDRCNAPVSKWHQHHDTPQEVARMKARAAERNARIKGDA